MLSQDQDIDQLRAEVKELRRRLAESEKAEEARDETKTVLESIAQGIAPATGEPFFQTLAKHLGRLLDVGYVIIGTLTGGKCSEILTVAVYADGELRENSTYFADGTPCGHALRRNCYACSADLSSLFPNVELIQKSKFESYVGVGLFDSHGDPLGVIAVLDRKPMANADRVKATLKIFASRVAVELENQTTVRRHRELKEQILETVPCGIVITMPDGTFPYSNPATRRIFGYDDDNKPLKVTDFADKTVFADGMPCKVEDYSSVQCLKTGEAQRPQTLGVIGEDGNITWARYYSVPIVDPETQEQGCLSAFIDITRLKENEEKLKLSEEFHRVISEIAADYAYIADVTEENIFLRRVTDGFARVTGYADVDELEAAGGWQRLIHPDDLPRAVAEFHEVFGEGQWEDSGDIRIVTKSGETRWIHYLTRPVRNAEGRVVKFFGAIRDITDRKNFEKELQETAAARQRLAHKLIDVQEQERRHLARELHDELGQTLTALRMTLDDRITSTDQRLHNARKLVRELQEWVRDASRRLRPSMLDDLGLLPTLLWHVRRYEEQTGIAVDLEHSGIGERFPSKVETGAYRIIQEALTNVARYAEVKNVTVRVWVREESLFIQVQDRGKGFDPQLDLSCGTTSGLSGMLERAELLGGNLVIESSRGSGSQINAELPLVNAQ